MRSLDLAIYSLWTKKSLRNKRKCIPKYIQRSWKEILSTKLYWPMCQPNQITTRPDQRPLALLEGPLRIKNFTKKYKNLNYINLEFFKLIFFWKLFDCSVVSLLSNLVHINLYFSHIISYLINIILLMTLRIVLSYMMLVINCLGFKVIVLKVSFSFNAWCF